VSWLFDLVESLLGQLETISSSPWFYLAIFGIALLDSVIPAVPSETTVILGGIAAGQGHLAIPVVIGLGALGAFIGDSIAYRLGVQAGPFITGRLFGGERGRARLEAAGEQIRVRGGMLLVTARFIPGGRTAVTFSCGLTGQPYGWFLRWDAVAVLVWATYAGLLGYLFGERFDHNTAFWWAFGTALSVAATVEVVRAVRRRRG
jgi:membrane protein DedA with SNARE-associated domain